MSGRRQNAYNFFTTIRYIDMDTLKKITTRQGMGPKHYQEFTRNLSQSIEKEAHLSSQFLTTAQDQVAPRGRGNAFQRLPLHRRVGTTLTYNQGYVDGRVHDTFLSHCQGLNGHCRPGARDTAWERNVQRAAHGHGSQGPRHTRHRRPLLSVRLYPTTARAT